MGVSSSRSCVIFGFLFIATFSPSLHWLVFVFFVPSFFRVARGESQLCRPLIGRRPPPGGGAEAAARSGRAGRGGSVGCQTPSATSTPPRSPQFPRFVSLFHQPTDRQHARTHRRTRLQAIPAATRSWKNSRNVFFCRRPTVLRRAMPSWIVLG